MAKATLADLNRMTECTFLVDRYADSVLTVRASFDFTMYEQFRIQFRGVHYAAFPSGFQLRNLQFTETPAPPEYREWYGASENARTISFVDYDGVVFLVTFEDLDIVDLIRGEPPQGSGNEPL